jgi:Ca2+:H+ antiporter
LCRVRPVLSRGIPLNRPLMNAQPPVLARSLLLLVPAAFLAAVFQLSPPVVFAIAFLALIPLANLVSETTEILAARIGPRIGGLLNATFGTLTELIVMSALLRAGQTELLKASIVGSILISLLLTVGAAILFGGIRNGMQRFDQQSVGLAATTMILAVVGLLVPTFFSAIIQQQENRIFSSSFQSESVDRISLAVAVILFSLYLLTVIYQLRAPEGKGLAQKPTGPRDFGRHKWTTRRAIAVLTAATIGIAILGEILSRVVEPFGASLGLSYLFVGAVILPVAGAISEMIVCVHMARNNLVNLAISIPMNGAMQVSLFVAPLLVFLSAFGPAPLTLCFGVSEVIAVAITVALAAYIAIDGVTSWLEGAQLLALWGILALWFYFFQPWARPIF